MHRAKCRRCPMSSQAPHRRSSTLTQPVGKTAQSRFQGSHTKCSWHYGKCRIQRFRESDPLQGSVHFSAFVKSILIIRFLFVVFLDQMCWNKDWTDADRAIVINLINLQCSSAAKHNRLNVAGQPSWAGSLSHSHNLSVCCCTVSLTPTQPWHSTKAWRNLVFKVQKRQPEEPRGSI